MQPVVQSFGRHCGRKPVDSFVNTFKPLSLRYVPFVLQQCVSRRLNVCGLLLEAATCPQPHVSVAQWEGWALCVSGRHLLLYPFSLWMVSH